MEGTNTNTGATGTQTGAVTETINKQGNTSGNTTNQTVTQPTSGTSSNVSADDKLFAKLDEIMEKKTSGIVKSILKSEGFEGDELSGLLNDYKTAKANKKTAADEHLRSLEKENEALKSEIMSGRITAAATAEAGKLGLDVKYIDKILKLADVKDVVKDGNIDNAKLSEALKKVGEDCPLFKTSGSSGSTGNGFVNIGADNGASGSSGGSADTSFLAKLRHNAGLDKQDNKGVK